VHGGLATVFVVMVVGAVAGAIVVIRHMLPAHFFRHGKWYRRIAATVLPALLVGGVSWTAFGGLASAGKAALGAVVVGWVTDMVIRNAPTGLRRPLHRPPAPSPPSAAMLEPGATSEVDTTARLPRSI
jgi:hypothetical protein